MKLNLGCGNNYKEGYINIDAFDSQVADKIMSADNLKYSSNSIEHIEAQQLIEHLGYYKTLYSLAEWYRVLKPEGTLLIETPDLETSFKIFLEGDANLRKNVITWIYGMESEGMAHLLCYPDDLLEIILSKTGFTKLEKTYFGTETNQPTVRIKCNKPKKYDNFQTIANFRKKLKKEKIVDINNVYLITEQEKLIDFFISKINKIKDIKTINEIVTKGAIYSPKMTKAFLNEYIKSKILEKKDVKKHIEVLDFLIKINYPSVLFYLIKESPATAGKQNSTFQTIEKLGKQSIRKMLTSEKDEIKVKKLLTGASKKITTEKIDFFSEDVILRKADHFYRKGIKEFSLKKYNKAINSINEAIKINRNNILYFWNRARLYYLIKNTDDAKKSYDSALNITALLKSNDELIAKLKNEKEKFSEKNHGKPITKMSGING